MSDYSWSIVVAGIILLLAVYRMGRNAAYKERYLKY